MLLSCDIVISICSNLFPYTLIGSGLFEVFNLEGEPDHQDSEGDRKDSDQPYQSQRAATPGLLEVFIDEAERRVWFLNEAGCQGDPTGH
jgi:hypothetical protein